MKLRAIAALILIWGLWASPASADNRIIVRTTLGLEGLQQFCSGLPILQNCSVVGALGDPLGQLYLITTPLDLNTLLQLLGNTVGIVDAEADQLLSMVGGLNQVTTPPTGLTDSTPVAYPTNSSTTVWDGYANQPAAQIVRVQAAQNTFHTLGTGIVADIDTGVDPNHPALKAVLLPGYDFTRNQPGGSEMTDYTDTPPSGQSSNIAQVNQSTTAVLDQSSAAILDGNPKYSAFGHGTMVMGIIHLVAPNAQLLPLKAFRSDGTGYLSDVLRAIYYAVQNKANVINMSFDFTSSSAELKKALDYANQNNVICGASAGNDGKQEIVYPAALQADVMGVASTSDTDARSSFSNYGDAIVWVAAPGEGVISTYPFGTYAAGWGTSFSAPFVSGAGALVLALNGNATESTAASVVAHAVPIGPDMGNGRLDLVQALQTMSPGSGADYAISLSPTSTTIQAGQSANLTVSVTPSGGFNNTVKLACSGEPANSTCTLSPPSVTLNGQSSASATVTVQTTARGSALSWPVSWELHQIGPWSMASLCAAWILFCLWLGSSRRLPKKLLQFSGATGMVLTAVLCISCGGGYSAPPGGPPPPPPSGGTPPGVSEIVVTGTWNNVSHAAASQLTVN
ncbi:MAG TPA: S8 family serine peptidase [Candidatus Acidoferrum sp.]|nr:S8 family serine peptidase [Candidatus Acidoferrum sp.]